MPKQYKIKAELNNMTLTVFSESRYGKDFLGRIIFMSTENNSSVYQISCVVSRKGFGFMTYQCLLMAAKINGFTVCSDRDAETTETCFILWNKLHKLDKAIRNPLSEKLNHKFLEFTSEEESPEMFASYSLEPTPYFLDNFSVVKEDSFAETAKEQGWDDFFEKAYYSDDAEYREENHFIDADFPMNIEVDKSHEIVY
tara:strand:- start:1605 stop:2198 length:594 start_codon:yes stop_codon:yes gene_type:complete